MNKYSRKNQSFTQIYVNGRVIGRVRGDTFKKTIRSNHILRKPPAIAFDIQSLQDAQAAGAVWVECKLKDTGETYRAKIDHIWRAGFEFDRGFGRQVALTLDGFIKSGQAVQIGMFAGV